MKLIARDLWQLDSYPQDMFNVYLAGDIVIDAATRWAARRILTQIQRRRVRQIALTHCHPDHQGCAHMLCRKYRIPLACHEGDVDVMEGRAPNRPDNRVLRVFTPLLAGPPHRVGRVLREGDLLGEFRVIHAPGHTPGHVIYFRDSDRVAIAGDVLANIHFITRRTQLREPPRVFNVDSALNRVSIRKLLALRPALICFGHGPPLHSLAPLEKLVARWN